MENYPKKVKLKSNQTAMLRLLQETDLDDLIEFYHNLPLEDRMFLRMDVLKKENIIRRFGKIDLEVMYPVIAIKNQKIIAIGTLYRTCFGWMRHLGELRCVVARDYQRLGLCTILVRELFLHAVTTDLMKIQAEIMEEQKSAINAFKRIGFKQEAVLNKHVTDIKGNRRNLVIMSLDIQELWNILEDFVHGRQYVV